MDLNQISYKFGASREALVKLKNVDLPSDPGELKWILEEPVRAIGRLAGAHLRAREIVLRYLSEDRGFVLFLRSFSDEMVDSYRGFPGEPNTFAYNISLVPTSLLQKISEGLAERGVSAPIIKLHGGADSYVAYLGEADEKNAVFSTTAESWEAVAVELIRSAPVIVIYVSTWSAGITRELERVQELGRGESCVLLIDEAAFNSSHAELKRAGMRDFFKHHLGLERVERGLTMLPEAPNLSGFASAFDVGEASSSLPDAALDAIQKRLENPPDIKRFGACLTTRFTYLEPEFERAQIRMLWQQSILSNLLWCRCLLDQTYWQLLVEYQVDAASVVNALRSFAHEDYGWAVILGNPALITEALVQLRGYYGRIGDPAAEVVEGALEEFRTTAEQLQDAYGCLPYETSFVDERDPTFGKASLEEAEAVKTAADRLRVKGGPASEDVWRLFATTIALRAMPRGAREIAYSIDLLAELARGMVAATPPMPMKRALAKTNVDLAVALLPQASEEFAPVTTEAELLALKAELDSTSR